MLTLNRRDALAGLALLTGIGPALGAEAPASGIRLGRPQPFSFAGLRERARKSASQPYKAPSARAQQAIQAIDYDSASRIRFRPDHALWRGGPGPYPVSFFHQSRYAGQPDILHAVENGRAREILYGPDYFNYSATGLDPAALKDWAFPVFG
jgi:glucans biosynthesis protein